MMKFEIPNDVKNIIETLNLAGYQAWCVGGCVRDLILGIPPKDYDIATSADPETVTKLFEKVIPTGIKHGTVTVVTKFGSYEVTRFRTDGEYCDHRHPINVEFTDDFTEDLSRRDFTVNAIGYNEKNGIYDPFSGVQDIKNKIIRTVGDPYKRFYEDALRMLRAVRFSAVLDFKISENTLSAIKKTAPTLENISAERITAELKKTLLSDNPAILNIIINSEGLTKTGLTSLPCGDALNRLDRIFELRLAALIQLCKASQFAVVENLKLSNIIKRNTLAYYSILSRPKISAAELKPYACDIGYDGLLYAVNALKSLYGDGYCCLENDIKIAKDNNDPYCIKMLKIGGNDLKNFGITGKSTGEMLGTILDDVLKHPEHNTKEYLIKYLKSIKNG